MRSEGGGVPSVEVVFEVVSGNLGTQSTYKHRRGGELTVR